VRWLSFKCLSMLGWRFEGRVPDIPKMILLGAPHTSNWDFIVFLAALHAYRIKVKYMGKDGLFRWPFGYFFRAFGGIPVSQKRAGGVVGQVVQAFADHDQMMLVVAPEGTRSPAPMWRSGFLHIAREADVPVVPVSLDTRSKTVDVGLPIGNPEDPAAMMDRIRDFYQGKLGFRVGGMGPVLIAEE
jgi:1-acyl-sn-glycerol-3-phosphate acyltransferase